MSSLSALSIPIIGAPRERIPFCDQKFQTLRLVAECVRRICVALFYKVISLSLWAFSSTQCHHFNLLATHHFSSTCQQLFAFLTFGNKIVDFSINSTGRIKMGGQTDEISGLKKVYGEGPIARWSQIDSPKVPLKKERLAQKEINRGCCFGIILDFISRYLTGIKLGKKPAEIVKEIAPLYLKGAPEEAQLAQIFYEGLDLSEQFKEYKKKIPLIVLSFDKKIIDEMGIDWMKRGVKAFENEFRQRELSLKREILNAFNLNLLQTNFEREKIILEKMGLFGEVGSLFSFEEEGDNNLSHDFQQFVSDLAEGVYQVTLMSYKHRAHALVFIKTADQCFILEPNYVTLSISKDEAATQLWNMSKQHYLNESGGFASFRSLALSSASFKYL